MNYVLAVFSNRTHTIQFNRLLKKHNIPCSIISTPRELSVSCGLSVKFGYYSLSRASLLINEYRLNSFTNFYLVTSNGFKNNYKVL